jgi:guanylate kinase
MPEAVQVFIAPPSRETLRRRLEGRGTDTDEQVTRRLQTADAELAAQPEFQHVVVNNDLDDAIAELVAIIDTELAAT